MRMSPTLGAAALLFLSVGALAGTPVRHAGDATFSGVPNAIVAGIQQVPPGAGGGSLTPLQLSFDISGNSTVRARASRQFLNRIVTPFSDPVVKTTSNVKVEQVGPVLFFALAPDQSEPIVLYVMNKGNELDSVTLMLTPDDVGPVDLTLTQGMAPNGPNYRFNGDKAKQWEQSSPFTDTITSLMRQLAMGHVPPGYAFRMIGPGDEMPSCEQSGLRIVPKQVIDGYDLKGYIGSLTNVSSAPVEFQEQSCAHPGVEAVASWPGPLLQPGESSEVYVVIRRSTDPLEGTDRPSALIGSAAQ